MMIAVILCVGLLASVTTSAKAAAVFPDELYMEESRAHVCTLTSAALLEEHPEGIVLYCGRLPHAVFLTDYADGMFYVADPAPYYAEGRIPLTEGWIGKCYGHDLDKILSSVTAYWSVTDAHVVSDAEAISLDTLSLGGAEARAVENARTLIAMDKAKVDMIVEALVA